SHMSELSTNGTLDLAKPYGYPIIAGHGGFHETSFGTFKGVWNSEGYLQSRKDASDLRWDSASNKESVRRTLGTGSPVGLANERGLSREQVKQIADLGGMLGVGVGPGATPVKESSVVPNCDGSSKS